MFHYGDRCNGKNANIKGTKPHPLNAPAGLTLGRTTQVGSDVANAFGLIDMHGNVAEMCSDWFEADNCTKSPEKDPQGPKTGSWERVLRGDNHSWGAGGCASPQRFHHTAMWPQFANGFRVMCEIRNIDAKKKEEVK